MQFTIYSILLITAVVALLLTFELYGFATVMLVFLLGLIANCVFVRVFFVARYRFANSLAPILYPRTIWILRWTCGRKCTALALHNFGVNAFNKGEIDKASRVFAKVIELDSDQSAYWSWRGVANFNLGNLEQAIHDFSEAISIDSKTDATIAYRGYARYALQDYVGAIEDFEKVHCTGKEHSNLVLCRAYSYEEIGHWHKAISDFKVAYDLDPSNLFAGIGLARLQACCPDPAVRDGKKAIENATNMCIRSDWKDWAAISVLGAAFAENEDFGEAVKYAQIAIELAPESEKPARALRLSQFQKGIPFRLTVPEASVLTAVLES